MNAMGTHPAGAASPMTCAHLYHLPIRRLLMAIKHGECAPPKKIGRRSVLKFADVERWLESFPTAHRSTTGGPNV
jgi:hypothetical protein